jgi:hypothetical protein
MARYDSFIVRIWRSTANGKSQWTGRLDHLQKGISRDFTSLDALLEHLRQAAAVDQVSPARTSVVTAVERDPAGSPAGKTGRLDARGCDETPADAD